MKNRIILSLAAARHDASATLFVNYTQVAAVQLERLTRIKTDGDRIPNEAIDEVLDIAKISKSKVTDICLSRNRYPYDWFKFKRNSLHYAKRLTENFFRSLTGKKYILTSTKEMKRTNSSNLLDLFNQKKFLDALGFNDQANLHFYDHHFAHVLPCLFHNPDWEDALLYSADGGGDTGYYSFRYFDGHNINELFGGDEWIFKSPPCSSLALAYGTATEALGWKINRHEGKLTGLAASGTPIFIDQLKSKFSVSNDGQILSSFSSESELKRFVLKICQNKPREDVASSFQELLHELVPESINALLSLYPTKNLGVSGGLFANVRLNQVIAEKCEIDKFFIYPAMSDAGLSTGGALQYLMEEDGMPKWLNQRRVLKNLYLGKNFDSEVKASFDRYTHVCRAEGNNLDLAVEHLVADKVVAIYTLGMEFGPRALGARSVLASPHNAEINQSLNNRMERSEFMPFAPFVRDVDAKDVFNLPDCFDYPARFMTITCSVKENWIQKIPAVVHIDGTARPQVICRADNPLYYDLLSRFREKTGIPVLINTSFNVHEEPIINSPRECANALIDDRVDAVLTKEDFYCISH